jgi:hypothetical protein
VSAISDWAGKVSAAAERIESSLAVTVVREQARDFLAIERAVTPKRTGRLAGSETIDAVTGGGTRAVAVVSPHTIYAQFREDGGIITKHGPGSLGNPGVGWFGHSVFQHGSHYVERAQAASSSAVAAAAEAVLAEFLAGL